MGFLAVVQAVYDYAPQGEGELAISEGDLLFVLEKGEDDWWKVKKKAESEEEDEEEGLVPSNYVEEVSVPFLSFSLGTLWSFLFFALLLCVVSSLDGR